MPEIPLGFSLDEDDDGFILHYKNADGSVTTIKMSPADLHALKAAIDLWSDRRMSQYRVENGSVQPIVVYPVSQARVLPDLLKANVLLTVAAPSGQQMTLSFPLGLADALVVPLSDLVAEIQMENPIKQ